MGTARLAPSQGHAPMHVGGEVVSCCQREAQGDRHGVLIFASDLNKLASMGVKSHPFETLEHRAYLEYGPETWYRTTR